MPDQPERVRQALEHPCPRCHAPAGIGCARPSGSMLPSHTVHAAREDAAGRVRDDDGPPAVIQTNFGRAIWRDCLGTLRERGDVTPHARRSCCRRSGGPRSTRPRSSGRPGSPRCIGSTGQAVANPQFKVASVAQERAISAYRTLLLTPDTRVATPIGGSNPGETGDDLDALDAEAAAGGGRRRG
jgi:hypothetical protein